jgi:hypothetical protein
VALQYSLAIRNTQLDAVETVVGTLPKLQIRTGAQPANCAAADSGTLLCEMTLPSDWMASAASGSKVMAGIWTGSGAAAGTAAHFRLKDNAGTVCGAQGSVTVTGGGGDLTVDNTSIAVSQVVNVTSFTLNAGNA